MILIFSITEEHDSLIVSITFKLAEVGLDLCNFGNYCSVNMQELHDIYFLRRYSCHKFTGEWNKFGYPVFGIFERIQIRAVVILVCHTNTYHNDNGQNIEDLKRKSACRRPLSGVRRVEGRRWCIRINLFAGPMSGACTHIHYKSYTTANPAKNTVRYPVKKTDVYKRSKNVGRRESTI